MADDLELRSFSIGEGDDAGTAIINCAGPEGREYQIKLDTMTMQTMASFLASSFKQVADQASGKHRLAPNFDRLSLELETKQGTEILRIFVTPTVYHEYSAASDTNLGRHLRDLGSLIDEDQVARSSPSTGSKH